jgi:hypothetical protein
LNENVQLEKSMVNVATGLVDARTHARRLCAPRPVVAAVPSVVRIISTDDIRIFHIVPRKGASHR